MVYIPLEAVMSKYYGESERLLAQAFSAAEALGGCIVFLDEIDSLATTRGGDMHEVRSVFPVQKTIMGIGVIVAVKLMMMMMIILLLIVIRCVYHLRLRL